MTSRPEDVLIYHITDIANLPGIIASGLQSDAVMVQSGQHSVIGYDHIKLRRLQQIGVDCCGSRYVGEFVPFYFCPRSPMLFTVNMGNTGSLRDVKATSSTSSAPLVSEWGFSGSGHSVTEMLAHSTRTSITTLQSSPIWIGPQSMPNIGEKTTPEAVRILGGGAIPWQGIQFIGCHNPRAAERVEQIMSHSQHRPEVRVKNDWYF